MTTTTAVVTAVGRAERKSIARYLVRRGFGLDHDRRDTWSIDLHRGDTELHIERAGVVSIVGPDAETVRDLIADARARGTHHTEDADGGGMRFLHTQLAFVAGMEE